MNNNEAGRLTNRWGDELPDFIPPCAGKSALFESDTKADQAAAVALCASCPAVEACERERQAVVEEFGVAVGVWAGWFWSERDYRAKGAA